MQCHSVRARRNRRSVNAGHLPSARNRLLRPMAATLGVLTLGMGASAGAQQLEEVVVTAQKRSQNLQDVPIAINAFNQEFLYTTGVRSISGLQEFTPGLEGGTSVTQPRYAIRGIGTSDFGLGADPAVGVYVDGVYVGRSGGSDLPFSDIELVEVLKGPQGTLFGRNTAAGAIQVRTVAPQTDAVEGMLRARTDDYDQRLLEGMLNVPVNDSLALRLNLFSNQRDGTVPALSGPALGDVDTRTWRVSALWKFSERGRLRYTYDNNEVDQDGAARVSINDASPGGNDPFGPTTTDVTLNQERRDLEGHGLQLNYDLGFAELEYIGSYREFDTRNQQDEEGYDRAVMTEGLYPLVYIDTVNTEDSEQHYHELRLTGDAGVFRYTVGVNYYKEDGFQRSDVNISTEVASLLRGVALPPNDYWNENYDNTLTTESFAAFGDVIWSATDDLNVTVGLRYTDDSKDFTWLNESNNWDSSITDIAFAPADGHLVKDEVIATSDSWQDLSPRIVVDYHWREGLMTFVSLASGYKAGGFNALAQNSRYDEETVDNLEIGLRSEWFDRRLVLNGSVYRYEYNDRQGTVFVAGEGSSRYETTTGDAEGTGLDLEATWLVLDSLTATLRYGYIDAQWTDYESGGVDRSGEALSTPEHQGVIALDYDQALGEWGRLQFHIDHTYSSAEPLSETSLEKRFGITYDTLGDDRHNTNARLSWFDPSDRIELALWSRNLFDREYATSAGNLFPGFLAAGVDLSFTERNLPRMVGLEAVYNF